MAGRARLLALPDGHRPAGGRLDALRSETVGTRSDLVLDYQQLVLESPPVLIVHAGRPWERVVGVHQPRRLRLVGAEILKGGELFEHLERLAAGHPGRTITSELAWRAPDGRAYYLYGIVQSHSALLATAQAAEAEDRPGLPQPIDLWRNWSPPPVCPPRVVPNPVRLRRRFGGDPVAVRLASGPQARRLFVGGVDTQGEERPEVDAVLNVGEEPSRWVVPGVLHPGDRWDNKGEGPDGMSTGQIAAEARWVLDHLEAGRRVLVHCSAGMNRSSTICCAVLILVEGLSAEAALERVRQQHPWARPDGYHWLALRWLASPEGRSTPGGAA